MWVNKHLALELYFTIIGSYIVSEISAAEGQGRKSDEDCDQVKESSDEAP